MAVFLLAMGSTATGAVIYVDDDASPSGNGQTWGTAYKYLQDAIADANSSDEIWVAEGTYKADANSTNSGGTGEREATFQLINGVAIYAGFAGGESTLDERDWQNNETILSGDLNGDDVGFTNNGENSYHVVTGSGTNNTAVLDGFTITAGNANGGVFPDWVGGGMWNDSGSPTVMNCTFSGNSAQGGSGGRGGGMYNNSSSPILTNCTFSGNSAFDGGGMFNVGGSPTLTNCTFIGNSADNGGGMYNWGSSPTVTNCTFSGNSAAGGGGMFNNNSSPTLTNCILWGNTASSGAQIYGSAIVTYSDVQGGWGGTGNIPDDPLFIGPNGLDGIPGTADDEDDNVHLRGWSPCINASDPAGNYTGQVDLDGQPRVAYGRVDMGADEVFPIAGDFEPDGDVDLIDFSIFANNYLLGL